MLPIDVKPDLDATTEPPLSRIMSFDVVLNAIAPDFE
jgi:hypothetical protein